MGLEVDSEETSCDDLREPTPRKEKWHKCPYEGCNASFRRPWRLDSHVCCHTGERPFKCGVEGCIRAYTNYSHLRRHITLTHEKKLYKTTHRCPYEGCMREFHALGSMRNHYNQAHERQLPYVCSHCKKGFRKHNQLKTHSFEHTGIPEFPCDMCEAKFVTMHHLKRHKRVHSKTYVCNVPECSKELKTWTLLRKHYMLDHPIKLKCATCDKEFRSKGSLNHHVMIHMDESKRTVYPCPYESCPRFYLAERNLNHHIRSSHEGKKHKCPHESCNRELSSKHRLQLHLNLHTSGHLKTVSLKQKTRKKRKDKGIGKRSLAVKLSGIQVPYEVEKLILSRDRVSPQDKFIKDCSVALNRLDQQFIKTDLCAKVESSHESASETEMCVCSSETEQSELELEAKSSAADPLEHNENYKSAQQATLLSKVETVLDEQNADTESLTGAENVCSVQLNKDDGSVNSKLHLPHTQGTEVTETANSGRLSQQTGPTLRKHYLKIHGESICLEMSSNEGEAVNSSEDDDLENALQAEMQLQPGSSKIIHSWLLLMMKAMDEVFPDINSTTD